MLPIFYHLHIQVLDPFILGKKTKLLVNDRIPQAQHFSDLEQALHLLYYMSESSFQMTHLC